MYMYPLVIHSDYFSSSIFCAMSLPQFLKLLLLGIRELVPVATTLLFSNNQAMFLREGVHSMPYSLINHSHILSLSVSVSLSFWNSLNSPSYAQVHDP